MIAHRRTPIWWGQGPKASPPWAFSATAGRPVQVTVGSHDWDSLVGGVMTPAEAETGGFVPDRGPA